MELEIKFDDKSWLKNYNKYISIYIDNWKQSIMHYTHSLVDRNRILTSFLLYRHNKTGTKLSISQKV